MQLTLNQDVASRVRHAAQRAGRSPEEQAEHWLAAGERAERRRPEGTDSIYLRLPKDLDDDFRREHVKRYGDLALAVSKVLQQVDLQTVPLLRLARGPGKRGGPALKRSTVYLPLDEAKELRKMACKRGKSVNVLCYSAVHAFMRQSGAPRAGR